MKKVIKYIGICLMAISAIIVLIGFFAGTSNNSTAQVNEMETVVKVSEQLADTVVFEESIANADTLVQQAVTQNPATQRKDYSGLLEALNSSIDRSISFGDILRGVFGLIVIIGIAWLFSNNRKAINWKFVAFSLLFQIAIALCIIYIPAVARFFTFFGKIFVRITMAAESGVIFLFGGLINNEQIGYMFAFKVLPSIIFFSTISSLLFYWGIIQVIVKWLGWLFSKIMGLSGVESLSLAGNIFLGQTEAPLIVKNYLPNVTDAELFIVMVGGMATMSGGTLSAYIALLGGGDPALSVFFARHLLAASVMAAPASVVIGRVVFPQTVDKLQEVKLAKTDKKNTNVLDVITNGAVEGMRLAVNVATQLLVFVALISLTNFILFKIGDWTTLNNFIVAKTNYNGLSLQFILGYALSPIMWLIGVPGQDMFQLGQLLGEKTIINEFVGYATLTDMVSNGILQPKSIIMGVYLLCGFANFSSVGIQLAGIGSLAPTRRHDLSRYGMKALLVAAMTALLSSAIMGTILG